MATLPGGRTRDEQITAAWLHFSARVEERLGGSPPPRLLWDSVVLAVDRGGDDVVQFCRRIDRDRSRRLWRVRLSTRTIFVVFDHGLGVPLTVLTSDMSVPGVGALEDWV